MNAAPKLLSVDEALAAVLAQAEGPLAVEDVALTNAYGRTLARDIFALRTQPPKDLSAMDGYALRAADAGQTLTLIGESVAGAGFAGVIGPGESARIFTGAPVPAGADAILLQEDAERRGDKVIARTEVRQGRHIRAAGVDFREGEKILERGRRLSPADIALAASADHAVLPLARRPRVAMLCTGDELVAPGARRRDDQIVASNGYALIGMIEAAGAEAFDLGIAGDNPAEIENAIARARAIKADIVVTVGGASVGDHDLVKGALAREGMKLDFWRVAMKPGKPLISGSIGSMRIIGLPGNPVSSVVCAEIFLKPLIYALCGDPEPGRDRAEQAVLGTPLPATGERQEFPRARLTRDEVGRTLVLAQKDQDSSLNSVLSQSDALIVRPSHAPPAQAGELTKILRLR